MSVESGLTTCCELFSLYALNLQLGKLHHFLKHDLCAAWQGREKKDKGFSGSLVDSKVPWFGSHVLLNKLRYPIC